MPILNVCLSCVRASIIFLQHANHAARAAPSPPRPYAITASRLSLLAPRFFTLVLRRAAVPWLSEVGREPTGTDGGSSVNDTESWPGFFPQKTPLIPRGLDLLPSMRTPRRLPPPPPPPAARMQPTQPVINGEPAAYVSNSSSGGRGRGNAGGGGASGGLEGAQEIEYVPCVGGGAGGRMGRGDRVDVALGTDAARRMRGIGHRVQWFPRGLPMEAASQGEGQVWGAVRGRRGEGGPGGGGVRDPAR